MIRKTAIAAAVALVLLVTGCSTMISIPYMQPSAVDMGGYRNLAVASVVPYNGYVPSSGWVRTADPYAARYHVYGGFRSTTSSVIASYATDHLMSTLSGSGFFNILPPARTDAILDSGRYGLDISSEFRALGYDAVMIPRIGVMSIDEYIYSEPVTEWWVDSEGYRHSYIDYEYYYVQTASIEYTITLIDTESGHIVAQRTFSDKTSRDGSFDPFWSRLDDPAVLFRRMISSFDMGIITQFVPTQRVYNVSLMANKPKNEAIEYAYDIAKDGDTEGAEAAFQEEWEASGHLPSGYNAALLMAATGDFDAALSLLEEVNAAYSSDEARRLYRDLQTVKARNEEALAQISGESSASPVAYDDGNSVYDAVLGM